MTDGEEKLVLINVTSVNNEYFNGNLQFRSHIFDFDLIDFGLRRRASIIVAV